eukprot:2992120-Rhodomonas_salina.1
MADHPPPPPALLHLRVRRDEHGQRRRVPRRDAHVPAQLAAALPAVAQHQVLCALAVPEAAHGVDVHVGEAPVLVRAQGDVRRLVRGHLRVHLLGVPARVSRLPVSQRRGDCVPLGAHRAPSLQHRQLQDLELRRAA